MGAHCSCSQYEIHHTGPSCGVVDTSHHDQPGSFLSPTDVYLLHPCSSFMGSSCSRPIQLSGDHPIFTTVCWHTSNQSNTIITRRHVQKNTSARNPSSLHPLSRWRAVAICSRAITSEEEPSLTMPSFHHSTQPMEERVPLSQHHNQASLEET